MKIPSIVDMLKAGVHFGHKTSRWYPKMEPYIFTQRSGIHVINLEKTQDMLEDMLEHVRGLAADGKQFLFVSTKPQAKQIVKDAAKEAEQPYLVERWIGGLFTNYSEVEKSIDKYLDLREQQETGELEKYPKKEQVEIAKYLEKKQKYIGGLTSLDGLPDVLFVPSVQKEKIATKEARKAGIEVVGFCDTNSNPKEADMFVPANDDAVKSIEMMVGLVKDAIIEGKEEYNKKEQASE